MLLHAESPKLYTTIVALPLFALTLTTFTDPVKHRLLTVTQTMLVAAILVFDSVIVSTLLAPSEADSLVNTPPMVFTVALALDTVTADVVQSKPCT